jgi:hypothetical protein
MTKIDRQKMCRKFWIKATLIVVVFGNAFGYASYKIDTNTMTPFAKLYQQVQVQHE